jgi:hypothetical protein
VRCLAQRPAAQCEVPFPEDRPWVPRQGLLQAVPQERRHQEEPELRLVRLLRVPRRAARQPAQERFLEQRPVREVEHPEREPEPVSGRPQLSKESRSLSNRFKRSRHKLLLFNQCSK